MTWTLEFAAEAEGDFARIFDHLADSYMGFGERPDSALRHAAERVRQVRQDADRILVAPHRGQMRNDVLAGCRSLSFGQAAFWFTLDEDRRTVRILAVFYGAEDARRRMLLRALGGG
ncbi:MAG: plasmid stabilization protein [Rhodobacteraceae bacterium]|nr:plasmid stabilization protein [Paracoccaceae bacterium]